MATREVLKFSKSAEIDLQDIYEYTLFKWSKWQADKYLAQLESSCESILNNPKKGRPHQTENYSYRAILCGSHLIFYEIQEDLIKISRILHSKRDYKTILNSNNEK